MATKKKVVVSQTEQLALAKFAAFGADDAQDWTAQVGYEWEALLGALVDAGGALMLRSSDQGRAISVGLFCGGAPAWQTARDTAQLLDLLQRAEATFRDIADKTTVPRPTAKARKAVRPS